MPEKKLKQIIEEHYMQEFSYSRKNAGSAVPRAILFYSHTDNPFSFLFPKYKKNLLNCAGTLMTEIIEQNKYPCLFFEAKEPQGFLYLNCDKGEHLVQISIRGNKSYLEKIDDKIKINQEKLEDMINKIESAVELISFSMKREAQHTPLIICRNYKTE